MNKLVLIVTNIPTPYRIPLFNEVARQLRTEGFRLCVVFGAWGYERRRWEIDPSSFEFDYHVLGGEGFYLGKSESISFRYRKLIRYIRTVKPALVIVSGYSIAAMKLWIWSILTSTQYCIWSGSLSGHGAAKSRMRAVQRRLLVSRAVNFIAYGSRSAEYLASLGAAKSRIFTAINTVDTEFYRNTISNAESVSRSGEKKVILYVGNLTAGKRVDLIMQALSQLLPRRNDFLFRIVGDGVERSKLEATANDLGIADVVEFTGFKQKEDVADYLSGATCFVFASAYDIWGLVLVEAMAAGVPCIASVQPGATVDLIEDGRTGFSIDFENLELAGDRIERLLDDPVEARRIGEAGREFVATKVSIPVSAAGFVAAVQNALPSD